MSLNRGSSALGNEQCVKIVENSFNTLLNNNAENLISWMSQYYIYRHFWYKDNRSIISQIISLLRQILSWRVCAKRPQWIKSHTIQTHTLYAAKWIIAQLATINRWQKHASQHLKWFQIIPNYFDWFNDFTPTLWIMLKNELPFNIWHDMIYLTGRLSPERTILNFPWIHMIQARRFYPGVPHKWVLWQNSGHLQRNQATLNITKLIMTTSFETRKLVRTKWCKR